MNTTTNATKLPRALVFAFVLVIGAAVGWIGSTVLAQMQDEPVAQEELLRHAAESEDGTKVVWVRRVELAPDVAMSDQPDIEHPAQEFVYVLDGTAVLTRGGEEPRTFEAGETWRNDFEQAHTLENGSSTDPLAVIVVWIGDEGDF